MRGPLTVCMRCYRVVDSEMKTDIFAEIAAGAVNTRRGELHEPSPPRLPKLFLASGKSDPKAAFKPLPKIDSAGKLRSELARERRRHERYLKDLAPGLPSMRISRELVDFQWRLETPEDLADATLPQQGGGAWASVKVPHFGGPLGRAVAYYRTPFELAPEMFGKGALFIRFGAVDYRAHVFVNGHYLGSHEGFFAPFEFEFSTVARAGENVLLVKVENDAIFMGNAPWGQAEEGDKLYGATGVGWDDPQLGWHCCPPGFGIYQDVRIEARSAMHLSDLWVRPFPSGYRAVGDSKNSRSTSGTPSGSPDAEVWIEVWSKDRKKHAAAFEISVHGQNFRQTVVRRLHHSPGTRIIPGVGDLEKPDDNLAVSLSMGPGLNLVRVPISIPAARRWEPETPWLYQVQVTLLDEEGKPVDTAKRQFGMREFRMDTEGIPKGRMYLNDREIKLRGANTMGFEQQDVFKKDFGQLVDDILLAKIGHLNFWRLTQRPVQPEVYDYADRLGLMLQTDLPLFGCMRHGKFSEGVRQAEEMERLIRSHPSCVLISYINEPFPNAHGQPQRHLGRDSLQAFFEAADRAVRVLNPGRVIKHVDGDYDPPAGTLPDNHCYCGWYNGHGLELGKLHKGYWIPVKKGWQYGCGEFGAEGLEAVELMRRHYPPEWLPATDEGPEAVKWSPTSILHAQTGKFHYMWFDTQRSLPAWVSASQKFQAWATRLFAERFRRDNRMVSFAIHLFIDAFPSGWMKTIIDSERRPKPAFFAYREALTPLMVNIRTDRWAFTAGESMPFEFWVCNDTHDAGAHLTLNWQIEQAGQVLFSQKTPAKVEPLRSVFQGFFKPTAPAVEVRSRFTLRLALADGASVLQDTAVDYEVFPKARSGSAAMVCAVGGGAAGRLARELGLKPTTEGVQGLPAGDKIIQFTSRKKSVKGVGGLEGPVVILVNDYAEYRRSMGAFDQFVARGNRVVFLNLPPGNYLVGGTGVKVHPCVMRPRQFASRATGHPLVEGFMPEDFRCWYDPRAGYFTPLLPTVFEAEGWEPILTNGNGIWTGDWKPMLAAAEKRQGAGSWIICQVELDGRTKHNPAASIFARRLVGISGE